MRATMFLFGLLILAASCRDRARWEEHTLLATTFMQAAVQRDSATMARLSVDSVPVLQARAAANVVPDFISSAAGHLELSRAWERDDADFVEFRVPYLGASEVMRMSFVRRDGRLLIEYVEFPERLQQPSS